MDYVFSVEGFDQTYEELEPLYREHYKEMQDRLFSLGVEIPPYNPRLDIYSAYSRSGDLITMVARGEGKAIGYCNVYLTHDMHNWELIAQEDTIFITKGHRNGVGKELVKYGLNVLKERGVKRLHVQAATDLRVAKLWARMGFKETSQSMTYIFKEN
jgi:hypothetical protein